MIRTTFYAPLSATLSSTCSTRQTDAVGTSSNPMFATFRSHMFREPSASGVLARLRSIRVDSVDNPDESDSGGNSGEEEPGA